MINERIALLVLNGEAGKVSRDPHYTKEFYQCMEGFAKTSVAVCKANKVEKFESHLRVAKKLYLDGNETVKNGILNVFLFSVLDSLDQIPAFKALAQRILPDEMLAEVSRQHYSSGI
jgi:hypothetical protein